MKPLERRLMDPQQRKAWSREIRRRCRFLRDVVELLPTGFAKGRTVLAPGPQRSLVMRDDKGTNLAQFFEPELARFTNDALEHTRALVEYVEHMEAEAYEARRELRWMRSQVDAAVGELAAAESLGLSSKDGQRRVRAAAATLRERRPLD